jgi:hypothetical protein
MGAAGGTKTEHIYVEMSIQTRKYIKQAYIYICVYNAGGN